MGKVFSPAEIAAGLIPEEGAHARAANALLDFFRGQGHIDKLQPGDVQSVVVYGSTVSSAVKPNIRSDVDVAFVYAERAVQAPRGIVTLLGTIGARHAVNIEPNILSNRQFTVGAHAIDRSFMDHLAAADPAVCYGDNLFRGVTWQENATYSQAFLRYCVAKERQFLSASIEVSQPIHEPNLHKMQRALELPNAIGRKLLCAAQEMKPEVFRNMLFDGSDKANIAQHVNLFFDRYWDINPSLLESMNQLRQLDNRYNYALLQTIAGMASLEEYKCWLYDHERTVTETAFTLSQQAGRLALEIATNSEVLNTCGYDD